MCGVTVKGHQLESCLRSTSDPPAPFQLNNDVNITRIDTDSLASTSRLSESDTHPAIFSTIHLVGSVMTAASMTESYMQKELHVEVQISAIYFKIFIQFYFFIFYSIIIHTIK